MGFFRRRRFSRDNHIKPIQLTDCDLEIVRLIHRHRFLRSSHIVSMVKGKREPILRRLQLLYHHGYLERPRAQIEYFHRGGSKPIVYGLGNKAMSLLAREDGSSHPKVRWGPKNRSVGGIFLEHALLVSEVMSRLEAACRERNVRLLREEDLFLSCSNSKVKPLRWKVNVGKGIKLGVIPDRIFGLELIDEKGNSRRAYFFLEADRGTMPVLRRNLVQTSFYRKLLAYEATWLDGIHSYRFGFHRFRVLTIATGAARVKSLVDACSRLKRGHGLFLFATRSTFESAVDILSLPIQTGTIGKFGTLLD
jgi:hypothetical protein